jgi:predicted dehydrogenase
MKRRNFIKETTLASVAFSSGSIQPFSARSYKKIAGSNDRVRMGLIGCGGRGMFVSRAMAEVNNVEFVAICDLYPVHLERAKAWAGSGCKAYKDFRILLGQSDLDAVIIATPDHWHAIPTVMACEAGLDIYLEKPLGHNIREGQAILKAARKYDRVVQIGTQHRSAPHWEVIREIIQSGQLGVVRYIRVWNCQNSFPDGIGKLPDSKPPEGVDWEFYLGPAPLVPYNLNRFVGTYRWFSDYCGGIITDYAAHRLDSMHQVMEEDTPLVVSASGNLFDIDDGGDIPDVLQVTYEYPGFIVSYESLRNNAHGSGTRTPGRNYYNAKGVTDKPNGLAFYGSNGTLMADRIGFEIFPEGEKMERQEMSVGDSTADHTKNFIECVRSRKKPVADVEIGHKGSNACHLGNIAYRTGLKFKWDGEKEEIIGTPEAAKLLGRKARKPWDLI